MPKSTSNFAYDGKTYFVGDEVPAKVASAVDSKYTEKPKPKKPEISEGE